MTLRNKCFKYVRKASKLLIFETSVYCHENTLDIEIEHKFIQNQVINMISVAITMLNPRLTRNLENL